MNVNGLINLVGWARSLDGHMVPHGRMPDSLPGGAGTVMVMVDQASQRQLRHESATTFDPRVEQDVDGRWRRLRRPDISIFDDDRRQPAFASEDVGASGRPMSAYVAPSRVWWADVHTNEFIPGPVAYERWRMIQVWLSRAAPVVNGVAGLPPGPIQWDAAFTGDFGDRKGRRKTQSTRCRSVQWHPDGRRSAASGGSAALDRWIGSSAVPAAAGDAAMVSTSSTARSPASP